MIASQSTMSNYEDNVCIETISKIDLYMRMVGINETTTELPLDVCKLQWASTFLIRDGGTSGFD